MSCVFLNVIWSRKEFITRQILFWHSIHSEENKASSCFLQVARWAIWSQFWHLDFYNFGIFSVVLDLKIYIMTVIIKCNFQNQSFISLFVCFFVILQLFGKKKKSNDRPCLISEKRKKYAKPEIQVQILWVKMKRVMFWSFTLFSTCCIPLDQLR